VQVGITSDANEKQIYYNGISWQKYEATMNISYIMFINLDKITSL